MTTENSISKLLSAPLDPDWTVETLAEQVLSAVALEPADVEELILDADFITDRQSRRLLRPLLACIARKSAAERATSLELYEGRFAFERPGRDGPVWILGEFKNSPGRVRVTFRRSRSAPRDEEPRRGPTVLISDDAGSKDSTPLSANDRR